jgi:hypothetical protein
MGDCGLGCLLFLDVVLFFGIFHVRREQQQHQLLEREFEYYWLLVREHGLFWF